MAPKWIETITGNLDDKRRWRECKARVKALPDNYRESAEAVLRYVGYSSGVTEGATLMAMIEGLVDLFEQAAADGTPIRAVVGDDPVEFAETFAESYTGKRWIDKERRRLNDAIDQAERGQSQ